ncbi:D-ribose pyranase [Cytobacillus oceanisediminis]|jgi:D-ribose pyranase|uniref:D-ribose pyranase n=1 Tax=Cytobacillus oceanisediminis TaxID=665099 RepID=UPI0018655E25|nr:D-ribose pyranase [Cytobacillus oceanisediminis]MBU8770955.1 D-ribose pyranase [Cytobacillus oceanisediminis]QOK25653.1 D-ribose pyranase [Cytobacillus oceanisediminis]
MKKNGILNSEISKVLSEMGHTDTIVIADCGLPIPKEIKRIDLALKQGTPSFLQVLEALVADMEIEKVTLAQEIKDFNPELEEVLENKFTDKDYVSHEEFKKLTQQAKAVIRSGEATPYANIILHSGVIF